MKLRHIEVFHAIYLTGSVSAAARALNVSQPGVSKVLKYVEGMLGFKLFDRIKGRLYPTEKGVILFEQIEPIFNKLTDLKLFANQLANNKKGRIRFAMTPAFGLEIAPEALAKFSRQYPDITIEVETLHNSEIIKAIQKDEIDIGMIFGAPNIPGIDTDIIAYTEFVCIAANEFELPVSGKLQYKDFNNLPLITLNEKSVLGHLLAGKLSNAFSGKASSHIIVETYYIAKQLVSKNAGIAIIDKVTAYSGHSPNIQYREISDPDRIDISIVSKANMPSSERHKAFRNILRGQMEQFNMS